MTNAEADHMLTLSFIDWMSKNRLNRIMLMIGSYEIIKNNGMLDELIKGGISITAGHHDSGTFFLPPLGNTYFEEKYYETHPEYFRLRQDKSRFCPSGKWKGQLIYDMRNMECINKFAENIKKWLADNPHVDMITVWPNDGDDPQCACDRCTAYPKMTNYAFFVNEIAKLVNKSYPNVKTDMIVYLDLWEAPVDIVFCEGLHVEVSSWGPGYKLRRFGRKDGTGLIGTNVEKNAMEWSRLSGSIAYYEYFMTNFNSKQIYCPMADEITSIYDSLIKSGYCEGIGSQIEPYNIWNYLFNFYVYGRKAYDAALTFGQMLDNFTKIFGAGAQHISEYIRYVEDFYEGQAEKGTESAAYFISNVDKVKVYELFEKAYKAEPEGKYRQNIRLLRMAFRYSDLHSIDPGNEELKYMSVFFGSYWGTLGQTGYGLAVYDKPDSTSFVPDGWYSF